MFKKILVPTDGSPMSRKAIASAVQLAREQGARVIGLWVGPAWEPNLYSYDGGVPPGYVSPKQHAAHVRKLAARNLAQVRNAAASARVPCTCQCVVGAFPHLEVIKTARRYHCDLIVMASHDRRGISRLLLGSVASKVLAHATIPVLIFR